MISITARNRLPKGAIFYYEPAATTFTGRLIANSEWIAADCVTLQTNDQLHIIPKRDIVGVPPTFRPPEPIKYALYGSKGDLYTLTQDGHTWTCTCRGFEFRRDCKHIRETKSQLESEHE